MWCVRSGMIESDTSNKIRNLALICACCVVFIHSGVKSDVGTLAWWMRQIVSGGFCRIAMPFFFFVSGYFLAQHMDEGNWYRNEMFKRVRTLLVPYLIFCTVGMVWNRVTIGRTMTLDAILESYGVYLLVSPAAGPLWYLRTLMVFVVLAPMVKWIVRSRTAFVTVLLVCALVGATDSSSGDIAGSYWQYHYFSWLGPIYFLVGVYASRRAIAAHWDALGAIAMLTRGFVGVVLSAYFVSCSMWLSARIVIQVALPLLLMGLWTFVPSASWPRALTSCSFPIFLLQGYAKAPVLWIINRSPLAFKMFHETACGHLMVAILVCLLAVMMSLAWRKTAPRLYSLGFGGR